VAFLQSYSELKHPQGEECNLDQLGRIADVTGGLSSRVDPANLLRSVALMTDKSLIATRVKVNFIAYPRFGV
jgi:hypothetical protein